MKLFIVLGQLLVILIGIKAARHHHLCPDAAPSSSQQCSLPNGTQCEYNLFCCPGDPTRCINTTIARCDNATWWIAIADPFCPQVACNTDAKICPDGSSVGRNPQDNCRWYPCPQRGCPEDAKICPDGAAVGRDPDNNCRFYQCGPVVCTQDARSCSDGSSVGRDPARGCKWFPCPDDPKSCTADAKLCPNGTAVGRDPDNNCDFFPCPGECSSNSANCDGHCVPVACDCSDMAAPQLVRLCPDGSSVRYDVCSRNENGRCVLSMGTCPKNASCQTDNDCGDRGQYCSRESHKCQAYRFEGERCGDMLDGKPKCYQGLRCKLATKVDLPGICVNDKTVCRKYAKSGEKCNPTLPPFYAVLCKPPLKCLRQGKVKKVGSYGRCRPTTNP